MSRTRIRVSPSAVLELGFILFVVESGKRRHKHAVSPWLAGLIDGPPALRERVMGFWNEPGYHEWGELLLLAWQGDALLLDDPHLLFDRLEVLASQEFAVPELPTEPREVRTIIRERLRQLRESSEKRAAYIALLRDLWAQFEEAWRDTQCAAAHALVRDIERQIDDGRDIADILPRKHLAWRDRFLPLVRDALEHDEVVITPLALVGEGQYFFALPGVLLVGFGPEAHDSRERRRDLAEKAAGRFKVLSDPTRLTLLAFLMETEMSISDLAAMFELSQPTVSVHMKMLREASLVEFQRRGAQTLYRARPETLRSFVVDGLDQVLGVRD